jgi:hypothetical protein
VCIEYKSLPSSAEVNNAWSCTSTPQYALMAWYAVKVQGQLYLYLAFTFTQRLNIRNRLPKYGIIPKFLCLALTAISSRV